MSLEQKVVARLIDTKKTLAIAESCTGGLLSSRITDIPGASECLKYSLVAYSNEAKLTILGTAKTALKKRGAVSEEVAISMSQKARKRLQSDFGVSITGIAGPGGGSRLKPVGLTYIAVSTPTETLCLKCQFKGSRKRIKKDASTQALKLLLEFIQ